MLGINISLSPSVAVSELPLVVETGAKWVRVSYEQSWTAQHSLDSLDKVTTAAHKVGLQVLQCCQGLLATQSKSGSAGHFPAKSQAGADAFGQWCAQCAAIADMVEIGNEWNGYGWTGKPDPHAAAQLTIAALAANQTHNMVTNGLSPAVVPNEPLAFFQAMCAAQPDILKLTQGVGLHQYCFPQDPKTPQTWNTCYRGRAFHEWLTRQGHQTMPIWNTEFGQPDGTTGVNESVAATHLGQYFAEFAAQKKLGGLFGPAFYYCLKDRTTASATDWSCHCGLLRTDGTRKPTYPVFAAQAAKP